MKDSDDEVEIECSNKAEEDTARGHLVMTAREGAVKHIASAATYNCSSTDENDYWSRRYT